MAARVDGVGSGHAAAAAPEPSEVPGKPMRIGEVAELTGVTTRTIRYYEEIGLLGAGVEREQGKHRCYSQAEVARLKEIVRLRDLLGLSLEQLLQLVEAETAAAALRREYHESDDPDRQRQLLRESRVHISTQLELVKARLDELTKLEQELSERRERIEAKLRRLKER